MSVKGLIEATVCFSTHFMKWGTISVLESFYLRWIETQFKWCLDNMALSTTRHFPFLHVFPFLTFFFMSCLFLQSFPVFRALIVSPQASRSCRMFWFFQSFPHLGHEKYFPIGVVVLTESAQTTHKPLRLTNTIHATFRLFFFCLYCLTVQSLEMLLSSSLRWPQADRTQCAPTCGLAKIGSGRCVVVLTFQHVAQLPQSLSQCHVLPLAPPLRPQISLQKRPNRVYFLQP